MSDPLHWIHDELDSLARQSLLRQRKEFLPLPDGRCQSADQEFWNFAGNDYLGLANHPAVMSAVGNALDQGLGARASALVTGRTSRHVELEEKLASWKHAQSTILFPTGYAANVGTITALVGREDIIYCDRLNHASLVDGARLSHARFQVFRHADVDSLRHELQKQTPARRRLIITDSLFSMDGNIAPLPEFVGLAEEFDAMLLVDEAHATGVFGSTGAGLIEEFGLRSNSLICVGTLSKAIGAQGGFVTGSKSLCEYLWNTARTGMFSTALAPPIAAGATAAIEIIQREPHRRMWICQKSVELQEQLRQQGWKIPEDVRGPIIPVIIGDSARTLDIAEKLRVKGVLVAAIRPPTVPKGTSRLRISLSFAHGEQGFKALVGAMASIV